jgi:hypothetical protein
MAVRQVHPGPVAAAPRVGDTVVLRPTTRQRVGSALLKALCAAPLLLALPVTSGGQRMIVIWVAVISALAAIAIDLLSERDVWVKLSPTGLTTRAGSVPWWAVDDIKVREDLTSVTVEVRSFETLEMVLPAPRNGPTGANPHFDSEVRLIMANWRRYNRVVPTDPPRMQAVLDRAEASAANARLEADAASSGAGRGEPTALIDLRTEEPHEPSGIAPVLGASAMSPAREPQDPASRPAAERS